MVTLKFPYLPLYAQDQLYVKKGMDLDFASVGGKGADLSVAAREAMGRPGIEWY